MNKTQAFKKVVNFVVTIGTGKIIGDIINHNTDPEGTLDKVTYKAGSFALGGLVAAETAKYTDARIDEWTAKWTKTEVEVKTDN